MDSDAILEAAQFGRSDGRAGRPMDPLFAGDDDDCSPEAVAYRKNYDTERRRLPAAQAAE